MKKFIVIALFFSATASFARPFHRTYFHPYHHTTTTVIVKKVTPKGWVDINSNRKKAEVYVNGKLVGTAGQYDGFPGKLSLKPGTYRIRVQYEDQSVVQRVSVADGREVNLNVQFK